MFCGVPLASAAIRPAEVVTVMAPAGTVYAAGGCAGAATRPEVGVVVGAGVGVGAKVGVGVAVAATLMGGVMTVVAPVTVECIEA